ncbi:MAG: DUF5989 family protein [Bryobacteraceae bacterium]|nr:DUF5989 family protein [Bryobacteraceae bacterium]
MSSQKNTRFEQAASAKDVGFLKELFEFLRHNRKWWMLPVVLALLGLGVLVFLSSTAAAPFIYTLF